MSKKIYTQSGISERLRSLVGDAGHWETIGDFAAMAGIPYRTMQNYMLGEREPNAAALTKIGTNCWININWLVTGQGRPYLADYLPEETLDKLLASLTPEILELCGCDRRTSLDDQEKRNIIGYLYYRNFRNVRESIEAFALSDMVSDLPSTNDPTPRGHKLKSVSLYRHRPPAHPAKQPRKRPRT